MGRRYYCDYCDKVFIDDLDARKKHLNSAHHLKLRKVHYDLFRDQKTLLQEESVKIPCRRFLSGGFCQFDSSCKYTHYSVEQLWQIKNQIEAEEQAEFLKNNSSAEVPPVETWMEKYGEQKNLKNEEFVSTFWSYPEQLETRPDLPPSLKKFQPEYFTDDNFADWG
ncbi:PREDICTED: zinc finger matrin-type protein 5 [Nicrophorus vespilloides]|uniref:Zinc finger matrin-type protein 5 n=1 Tax=Nicrophorus vespilloides TaxID=110193 RepID=A0ABM1M6M9_NICVS|nr:PREDICTED: zinc finger matrin-type protein 5 [Nicrophorus vespilloides]